MNALNRNRQQMLKAVQTVANNYQDQWEAIPDYSDLFQKFDDYVQRYAELRRERQELKASVVHLRDEHWMEFADTLQQLSSYMLAKAREKGENSLISFLQVGAKLKNGNIVDTLNLAERILEVADEWVEEGDSDWLKELHQKAGEAVAHFAIHGLKPQERRRRSAEAGQHLATLYREIGRFFREELDVRMFRFKQTAPEFYLAYKKARKIPKYNASTGYNSNSEGNAETAALGGNNSGNSGMSPPGSSSGDNAAEAA